MSFDDGPDPRYTPAVLRILKEYGAKATFFDVGVHVKKYPRLVYRELAAGDEVENHTYSHPHFTRISAAHAASQIRRGAEALESIGVHPTMFREPYGDEVLKKGMLRLLARLGERPIGWSAHACVERYAHAPPAKVNYRTVVDQLMQRVRPGAIILSHDGSINGLNRSRSVRTLPFLFRRLKASGYRIVSVGQLRAEKHKEFRAAQAHGQ